jgi:hypothetical protein
MRLIAFGFAGLGGFVLSAHLALADDTPSCPDTSPPACEEVRIALSSAHAAVLAAADQRALWTTADDALRRARAAFLDGDYPGAIRAARTAAEQAQLGIAQTHYPMFQLPKL